MQNMYVVLSYLMRSYLSSYAGGHDQMYNIQTGTSLCYIFK
jgi:hypothetical protein